MMYFEYTKSNKSLNSLLPFEEVDSLWNLKSSNFQISHTEEILKKTGSLLLFENHFLLMVKYDKDRFRNYCTRETAP